MVKPVVVVSKCLGFAKCRWNNTEIPHSFIQKLRNYVNFIPVCPEVEIGLGIPRDPIRIVNKRLIQPKTGNDYTEKMNKFSDKFLNNLKKVDGFILKYKSPSCGFKNVPIYPSTGRVQAKSSGPGFFGEKILEKFKGVPIEDEGRLRNFKIREHFLTKLFLFADFRQVKKSNSISKLLDFHSKNRLLIMAYSQKELKSMGKILGEQKKTKLAKTFNDYEEHLHKAFAKCPRYTSNINVLMHAYSHFADKINKKEREYFHKLIKEYKDAKIPFTAILTVLEDWIIRFDDEYLKKQNFFNPHPIDLLEITDSGKGRNS
ncbi:DUF523 and DUF1722 domain-containing protein [Candidatus Woesearchaeota archaeon]|nr:DUF523 and DUF1722 domain-containing protein [Candidatus Woesearchaeota archaeon]